MSSSGYEQTTVHFYSERAASSFQRTELFVLRSTSQSYYTLIVTIKLWRGESEFGAGLTRRNLLILLNAKNARKREFAQVRYTWGTRMRSTFHINPFGQVRSRLPSTKWQGTNQGEPETTHINEGKRAKSIGVEGGRSGSSSGRQKRVQRGQRAIGRPGRA
jgi:hypothetical protein